MAGGKEWSRPTKAAVGAVAGAWFAPMIFASGAEHIYMDLWPIVALGGAVIGGIWAWRADF